MFIVESHSQYTDVLNFYPTFTPLGLHQGLAPDMLVMMANTSRAVDLTVCF